MCLEVVLDICFFAYLALNTGVGIPHEHPAWLKSSARVSRKRAIPSHVGCPEVFRSSSIIMTLGGIEFSLEEPWYSRLMHSEWLGAWPCWAKATAAKVENSSRPWVIMLMNMTGNGSRSERAKCNTSYIPTWFRNCQECYPWDRHVSHILYPFTYVSFLYISFSGCTFQLPQEWLLIDKCCLNNSVLPPEIVDSIYTLYMYIWLTLAVWKCRLLSTANLARQFRYRYPHKEADHFFGTVFNNEKRIIYALNHFSLTECVPASTLSDRWTKIFRVRGGVVITW